MKNKRIILVFVTFVALAVTAIASLNTDQNAEKQDKSGAKPRPVQEETVFDAAQEPQDSYKRAHRRAKNRRYDIEGGFRLTDLDPGKGIGIGDESHHPAFIPTSESDVILLGVVKSIQPYISENETNIYTEFTADIEEVIKNTTVTVLAVGGQVVFDRVGGALRLPNGRIARLTKGGRKEMPSIDGRYLLFLKSANQGQDLQIFRAYQLRDNRVFPLYVHIDERNPHSGVKENTFLSEMRTAAVKK